MRIGIDLDGVCYDFSASLRHFLVEYYGVMSTVLPEPERWEFYEDWGYSLDEFIELCNRGVDAGVIFSWGDPFPGTVAALKRLKDAGHTIHIITDRSFGKPGASERATRDWLEKHQIPYDTVHFTHDKTSVDTDYMIEDKIENYLALRTSGVEAYLLDRPWNQGPTAYRVKSLDEFVDIVLAASKSVPVENLGGLFDPGAVWVIPKDGEVRITSSTGGQKGQKLARFDLIPVGPLTEVARLYGKGAEKYKDRNWERGYDFSLSYAALMRHVTQFWNGEDRDEETGALHLASVVFHAFALMEFLKTHPEFDNRPKAAA